MGDKTVRDLIEADVLADLTYTINAGEEIDGYRYTAEVTDGEAGEVIQVTVEDADGNQRVFELSLREPR